MEQAVQVSVICVTYNHEKYIKEALDSILMQKTSFSFEIRVGEDCSTDSTRDILKEYEEKYPGRFIMYYRDKNMGATRNEYELFMDAKGKYIAFLDADDIWHERFLEEQLAFMKSKNAAIVFSSYRRIEENTKEAILKPFIVPEKVNYKSLLKTCPIFLI